MKGRIIWLILLLAVYSAEPVRAQHRTVRHRLILVGDAGEMSNGRLPVMDQINRLFPPDSITTIFFLGDNVYPNGMPAQGDKYYEESKAILDLQAELGKGNQRSLYFIPGNHDWDKGRTDGWQQLLNQQRYIDSLAMPNVQFLPRDGCPGPVALDIGVSLTVIVMDSQWWLHPYDKPGETDDCDCKTTGDLEVALNELISERPGRAIVLAMHHPILTYGEHGGHFQLRQHIFPLTDLNHSLYIPLPLIGSIYPLSRKLFGNIQDTRHPVYQKWSAMISRAAAHNPYTLLAAGHEHGLQFLERDSLPMIVSGGGSKHTHIDSGRYTRFRDSDRGFAVLEMDENGNADIAYYGLNGDSALYRAHLFRVEPVLISGEAGRAEAYGDSIRRPVSLQYAAGRMRKRILGTNYRDAWATPVEVKVFDISKEHGGLTIAKRGGGLQTRSLRLEDKDGKEYVLRSLEKFPESAIPEILRETFARDIVQDQISASFPFAALTVPTLANAAGVPSAHPQIVYVPDDARLGKYRNDFANAMYLYEEREPVKKGKTYSTPKMLEKLEEDNDHSVDQEAVLRARLLDIFIADWDRHEDQWRWDAHDAGKGKRYSPVPRDRDQVYFVNQGWLPKLASRPWLMPKFQGFQKKIVDINRFNFNARYFDRLFLNNLGEKEWQQTTRHFLAAMTDSVIRTAILQLPPEIFAEHGESIIQTLQQRRQHFERDLMTYYRFLAQSVSVYGSNKREVFLVRDGPDAGSVNVQVYKLNKNGEREDLMFSRLFLPRVTKEICLYGLGGADSFDISVSGRRIRIRLIGGAGPDHFDIDKGFRPFVYDLTREANDFSGNGRWRSRLSNRPEVNQEDRRSFHYNITAPLLWAGYNPDDGLLLGAGVKHTHYGFRRAPSAIHQFTIAHSLATRAYMIRYRMQLLGLWHKAGLELDARLESPDYVINFFGYGNGTTYDNTKNGGIEYYRTRFDLGDVGLLWRYQATTSLALAIGPAFQYFAIDSSDNFSRYINETADNGLDSALLYRSKLFTGGRAYVELDTRNNPVLPSRGVWWTTRVTALRGLNRFSPDGTQMSSDLRMYWSSSVPANWVLAARFMGGTNLGEFTFYQAQYLGGTENLRGYRKYRFAGKSMLVNNIDLRIKVADFQTYLFPGSWGITLFHDIGRVWYPGDDSREWHNGYGGGIWIAPLKTLVLSGNYCLSKESKLFLLSLGYQF